MRGNLPVSCFDLEGPLLQLIKLQLSLLKFLMILSKNAWKTFLLTDNTNRLYYIFLYSYFWWNPHRQMAPANTSGTPIRAG